MNDHLRSQQRDRDLLAKAETERDGEDKGWPGKASLTSAMASSSGAALPQALRGELEGSLGTDLGGVRVHTDAGAEKAASSVHAKAFTLGQSIYFNRGFFNPGSKEGRGLLAHEVAHTVQQRGASTGGAAPSVSSPGDAHEREAHSFGDMFASRAPAVGNALSGAANGAAAAASRGPVAPLMSIGRGVISRSMIQRDLLDGDTPPGLEGGSAINARQLSPAEISEHAREAIKRGRSGGTAGVVREVHTLRGGATATTRGPIESAISSELTDAERDALNGKQQGQGGAGQNQPGNHAGDQRHTTPANNARNNQTSNANNERAGANGANGERGGANGERGAANGGGGGGAGPDGENRGGDAGVHGAKHGQHNQPGAQPGREQGGQHGPHHAPTGAHAGAENAERREPAGESAAPNLPASDGRALIEQELAFHDRWRAMGGGREGGATPGERAAALFSPGNIGRDALGGGLQGLEQFAFSQATHLVTTHGPLTHIPGAGNIIGGVFSAINLFNGGGREMLGDMGRGFGGALNAQNWRESPWLTLANLIGAIKSTCELIANVLQILSGLAYAFAAIAAFAGLFAIFFPPLGLLVPYIPIALQFGRACGGIAQLLFAVAVCLSPLPPVFRALHIIFSQQDPAALAFEEEKFHTEAQGAIANYTGNRLNNRALPASERRSLTSSMGHEMTEGASSARNQVRPGAQDNVRAGIGSTQAEMSGSGAQRTAASERYLGTSARGGFSAEGRANRREVSEARNERMEGNEQRVEGADADVELNTERRDHRRERLADAQAGLEANPNKRNRQRVNKQTNALAGADRNLANAESGKTSAEERAEVGGLNASNRGNITDSGVGGANRALIQAPGEERNERLNEASGIGEEGGEGGGEAEVPRNAAGHIQLPDPPASLQDIDQMDHEIQGLRQGAQMLRQNAASARALHLEATQQATGLTSNAAGVQQYLVGQQQRGQQGQARITAQTTDITTRTGTANQQTSGQTTHASGSLQTIASGARTLDGFLGSVPSNRFFDISSTKNNVHQFVVGMDAVTNSNGQQQQQNAQTQTGIAQRNQQQQQAAQRNQQGFQAGMQVHTKMTADAATARTGASSAAAIAAGSQSREQQTQARIQQLTQQRQQRWSQLMAWAAEHRRMREVVNPNRE
ncbi:MAG TPA: DUF4157 domain-containing protein [Kofleriaceae bacterium]